MKFIVSASQLLQEVNLLSGVISSNTVLPILEDFLFDINDGKLRVSATDLETSMATQLDVEAKENGKIAIPAKILMETLKTLPDQPLTFDINPKSFAVEITSENGKYKLAGDNGDDFPKIPLADDAQSINMNASALSKAINLTLFAVSNDDLRPAMTGVYFQMGSDGLTFVSTDAHKLVRYKRSDITTENSSSFIIPKKALGLLKGALPGDDTQVAIAYNSTNAFFTFGNVSLICRLVDAKYPDYNTVIPTDNTSELKVDRGALQNSLRRISIYSNKTTHQVIMKIKGNDLQVSAQDLDFSNEANEKLICEFQGEDMEIGFNAKFLVEMLGVIGSVSGNQIKMELSTPTRAGIILPMEQEDGEDLLMLVMPVMLNT